ncbi:MAG: VWA domain-containing protein [Burkholderiales bacterium]
MSFLWPQYLWVLLAAPLLAAAYVALIRRHRRALRFASLDIVKEAMRPGQRWKRHVPPALFLLAIIVALLATARPTAMVILPAEHKTLILAIDVSLSMRATDVQPSRMVAAQTAAKEFVQNIPADVRVGIVSFAGTAALVQAPTRDREELTAAIDRFEMQRHTAIGSGIIVSLAALFPDAGIDIESALFGRAFASGRGMAERKSEKKAETKPFTPVPPGSYPSAAIVLLTDGRRTTGPDSLDAARMAADRGVRVFTVGFGSAAGGMVNFDGMSMYMQFDSETLKAIASLTRAEYFHASSAGELAKVYENLSTKFSMEKKETEVTALMAGLAAVLAALAAGLSLAWAPRLSV